MEAPFLLVTPPKSFNCLTGEDLEGFAGFNPFHLMLLRTKHDRRNVPEFQEPCWNELIDLHRAPVPLIARPET